MTRPGDEMIDLDRLRNARDADYESGSHLCNQAADEIERLRSTLPQGREAALEEAARKCLLRADELAFDAANPDAHDRNGREACQLASEELATMAADIRALKSATPQVEQRKEGSR